MGSVLWEFQNYNTKIVGVSIILSNPCVWLSDQE